MPLYALGGVLDYDTHVPELIADAVCLRVIFCLAGRLAFCDELLDLGGDIVTASLIEKAENVGELREPLEAGGGERL